jgi:hypothetical protein
MKIEDRISRTIKVHKVICCDSISVCRIWKFQYRIWLAKVIKFFKACTWIYKIKV